MTWSENTFHFRIDEVQEEKYSPPPPQTTILGHSYGHFMRMHDVENFSQLPLERLTGRTFETTIEFSGKGYMNIGAQFERQQSHGSSTTNMSPIFSDMVSKAYPCLRA